MNRIQQFLTRCLVGVTILSLSSCGTPPVDTPTQPQVSPEATISPSTPPEPQKQALSPANTVPVTIYQVDNQCSELIPRQITVPKEQALETAISEVLEQQSSSDFPLNYRINVDKNQQIVTIDFRVPTTAERTFNSLSSCEQLALFGSLRQTITSNPDWQINDVIFTEQGEEITL
ncbi:hypothetical protein PCC9214_01627 [Planktothrix tepida]|uniref:Uncharacterized protein n=2 Tax=Planktothrix TaxID=54304 RepID=A0A1J1LN44_9CYAN|nr:MULTISPECIES: GerMN domain-containing protein [Planktothrix]CAD5936313.1 hypothetical protein PCC9214_01627 [Planktothrix tepida]CAD5975214.1 hypothetical protein NO713_04118 [Planktothrix pseudagardhii]CUR33410.1 conserved hypothetical protein [Planktothrix tepida PCC 9214]